MDYSRDIPFVDPFKSSRPWISGSDEKWDDGRQLDLDEEGWVRSLMPGQVARTLMLTMGGHPGGDFIVIYDGEGEIAYGNELLQSQSRPGREVIRVKKDGAVRFAISKNSRSNPIRNIRVFPLVDLARKTTPSGAIVPIPARAAVAFPSRRRIWIPGNVGGGCLSVCHESGATPVLS